MTNGLLVEVLTMNLGSQTTAAVASGATAVPVEDLTDFDDSGGRVQIAGVVYDYAGIDEDTDEVLLVDAVDGNVAEDEPVWVLVAGHVAVDYYALVDLGEGDGELVWVPLRTRESRVAWPVRVYDPPLPVTLSEDLSSIIDAPGVIPDIDGSLIPAADIDDPTEAPGVINYYTKVTTDLVDPVGLCRNVANTGWVTVADGVLTEVDDNGAVVAFAQVPDSYDRGVTRVGSLYYILFETGAVAAAYDASLVRVAFVSFTGTPVSDAHTIGTDGTDLILAHDIGATFTVRRHTTAGAFVDEATGLAGAADGVGGVYRGSGDFGAARIVVHPATADVKVFDTSGVEQVSEGWPDVPSKTITGLWWDGTYFWTIATDGVIRRYEADASAPAGQTFDWAYAYVDSDTHTTLSSPVTTKTRRKRAAIRVSAPAAPQQDEFGDHVANRIAVYGALTGDPLRLQTTLDVGVTSAVAVTVTTTGALEPDFNSWKHDGSDAFIADRIADPTSATSAALELIIEEHALLDTNVQTGATYTLALTDANKVVRGNHATGITITIPPNSSVAFPVGTVVEVLWRGAGTTTIATGVGVTMNGKTSASAITSAPISARYGMVRLWQRAADAWIITGDFV